MKILYLILGGATEGVRNKIFDKAAFMTKAGADVSMLIISSDSNTVGDTDPTVLRVEPSSAAVFSKIRFLWRFVIFFEQRKMYSTLSAHLKKKDYDVVLMRYPIADIFLVRFMKAFSSRFKIVFEHNTLEEEELKLRSTNSGWYSYFYWSERWFGKLARVSAAGMVGVTGEIQRRQSALVRDKVPSTTITNGIDVSRIPIKAGKLLSGNPVKLLFLSGSESPWHGVDILLNSLRNYPHPHNIHCYIAGPIGVSLRQKAACMENVTMLDHQTHHDLDRLVDGCDVGIGSLALFRNHMQEACTLKVREYWARGLPFVLGYDDSDLINNKAMEPFYLKLPINMSVEPSFDLELVVAFANSTRRIENASMIMRTLALQQINYPVKANNYLTFFKGLCR